MIDDQASKFLDPGSSFQYTGYMMQSPGSWTLLVDTYQLSRYAYLCLFTIDLRLLVSLRCLMNLKLF